jgi:hypothetical protein
MTIGVVFGQMAVIYRCFHSVGLADTLLLDKNYFGARNEYTFSTDEFPYSTSGHWSNYFQCTEVVARVIGVSLYFLRILMLFFDIE